MTRCLYMHPITLMILGASYNWALENNMPFQVTSTVSTKKEDSLLGRVSSAHAQGRAFDISIRGWTTEDIDNFKTDLEREFGEYGAYSRRDKERRLVVVKHDHIHIQINMMYLSPNELSQPLAMLK